jgi:hypothetical protein
MGDKYSYTLGECLQTRNSARCVGWGALSYNSEEKTCECAVGTFDLTGRECVQTEEIKGNNEVDGEEDEDEDEEDQTPEGTNEADGEEDDDEEEEDEALEGTNEADGEEDDDEEEEDEAPEGTNEADGEEDEDEEDETPEGTNEADGEEDEDEEDQTPEGTNEADGEEDEDEDEEDEAPKGAKEADDEEDEDNEDEAPDPSDCMKPGPPILISNTAASLPFKLTWSPPQETEGEILIYKVIYRLVGAESPDGEKWFTLTTTKQTFWDID